MNAQTRGSREVRIALVLYGGVSLAVYENGVTRCFYDLVRSRGLFKILLGLLDASAVVDVITGTSAGGLNGLMLAAALESGQEFSRLTELWRRTGDLGVLLRKVNETDDAESILDGQLFHDELVKCFQDLCKIKSTEYQSPGEMDVFITGTDLDGHLRAYQDSLGRQIEDKEHRVIFHLKHRPGRKSLGIAEAKSEVDSDAQAKILGAIGRITASFPVAFEPVAGQRIGEEVSSALGSLAAVGQMHERSFVDGGVLDNKPFGPALRAIFYRMPIKIVDRRLFYVEPDPGSFADKPKADHSPVSVGFASLVSIPGYEGIAEDLERLLKHNQRVRWLSALKKEIMGETFDSPAKSPAYASDYLRTRIESLARSLVIDCDGVASANDYPKDSRGIKLLEELRTSLKSRFKQNPDNIDHYDIAFHMRRCFDLLYTYYDDFTANPENENAQRILFFLGRIIKMLKAILGHMSGLRDQLMAAAGGKQVFLTADEILDLFGNFLGADAPWWQPISASVTDDGMLKGVAGPPANFLDSKSLSAMAQELKDVTVESLKQIRGGGSILEEIAVATQAILDALDKNKRRFTSFALIDEKLYPLIFTSGIYELDEMEFVRISPADAKIGLAHNDPHAKVAGDKLAHFSAFLRRDWRSNDILQGRFDGICQIVLSLLDDQALGRALSQSASEDRLETAITRKSLEGCPENLLKELHDSWKTLIARYKGLPDPRTWDNETRAAARNFRKQLIIAGQQDALTEDLETVFEDQHFQEIKFGRYRGRHGATSGANDLIIEADARQAADMRMKDVPPEDREKEFRDLNLGSQDICGPDGQVPNAVVGEYGTLAYLMLWGMLRRSLGDKAAAFMDKTRVKLILRMPVRLMYQIFMLFRRERASAVAVIAAITGILVGVGGSAVWMEKYKLFALTLLALILDMAVIVNLFSYRLRRAISICLTTIVVVAAALLVFYWPRWFQALVTFLCNRLNVAP
jgi:predicted acylesterase/phospholipase RssA